MSESEERGFVADLPDFAATDDASEGYAPPTLQRRTVRRRSAGATVVLATLLVVVLFPRQIGAAWGALWSRFGNHAVSAAAAEIGTLPGGVAGLLTAGPWQRISTPEPLDTVLALVPIPQSGGAALVCSAPSDIGRQKPGERYPSLRLWRSAQGGIGWHPIAIPSISAGACTLSIAPDAPDRIALMAGSSGDAQRGCAMEQIWLSDDGGKQWHQIPHASMVSATTEVFTCNLWVTARHIYLTTTYQSAAGWHTIFERSDDARSWQRVQTPQGGAQWINLVSSDRNDSVLATTVSDSNTTFTVWASHDAGRTWHAIAPPSSLPYAMVPPMTSAPIPSPLAPLYAAELDEGIAVHLQEHLLQTTDGQRWDRLPALPVPGLSEGQTGIVTNVGVLASGDLVALGADPHHAAPLDVASLASLWVWDWQPLAQRWNVAPIPVPGNANPACCTAIHGSVAPDTNPATHKAGTFLWIWSSSQTAGALYRLFLPSLDSTRFGPAVGGSEPQ